MRSTLVCALLTATAAACGAAEVPLADFVRPEQYSEVRISPDGKYLAVRAQVHGQFVLELITEGHGFYDEAHQTAMYEKILAFLDKNIGGAPAAAKQ